VSFVVLSIERSGFFLNRVAIEAVEDVMVERLKFRMNSVQTPVIGQHNDLMFKKSQRASIYVSKKIEQGSRLTVQQVSQAVSAHRWQWLAIKEE